MNLNEQETTVILWALRVAQGHFHPDLDSYPRRDYFENRDCGKPDLPLPTHEQMKRLAEQISAEFLPSQPKKIEVIVACYSSQGIPGLVLTDYDGTESDVNNGDHYEIAQGNVIEAGYHGPFVCFDEGDLGEEKWAAVKAVAFTLG
jgi:hypothetical protein